MNYQTSKSKTQVVEVKGKKKKIVFFRACHISCCNYKEQCLKSASQSMHWCTYYKIEFIDLIIEGFQQLFMLLPDLAKLKIGHRQAR